MSLVGDALRKARREAAERDAHRRGILYSARVSEAPGRSYLGLGLVLGAVIALAATIAGGTAVWWFLGRGRPAESVAGPAAITPAVAERDAGETTPSLPEGAAQSQAEEPETVSVNEPAAPVPAPALRPEGEVPEAAEPPREAPSNPSASSSSEEQGLAAGFAGVVDGEEVYVLEADLGDVKLSLDYIVFRAEDPFTEINDVELHLGGTVAGFRVKAIERDRVHLTDGRRSVVLRTP